MSINTVFHRVVLVFIVSLTLAAFGQIRFVDTRIVGNTSLIPNFVVPITNLFNWSLYSGAITTNSSDWPVATLMDSDASLSTVQNAYNAMPDYRTLLLTNRYFSNMSGVFRFKSRKRISGVSGTILSNVVFKTEGFAPNTPSTVYWHTNPIISGATHGSTQIIVASNHAGANGPLGAGYALGQVVAISEYNTTNYVWPYGYEEGVPTGPVNGDARLGVANMAQMVRITNINGTTIGFTPPLRINFTNSPFMDWHIYGDPANNDNGNTYSNVHIANIRLKNTEQTTWGIELAGAHDCSITNIIYEMSAPTEINNAVYGQWSTRVTVFDCQFLSTNYTAPFYDLRERNGMILDLHTDGWRVENNLYFNNTQSIVSRGRGGGHAIIYNYMHGWRTATNTMLATIWAHWCHPTHVLLEGNQIDGKVQLDTIHGSVSHWTLFRNSIRAVTTDRTYWTPQLLAAGPTIYQGAVSLDVFSYHHSLIGNVFGTNGDSTIYAKFGSTTPGGDPQTKSFLTFDYSGFRTNVPWGNGVRSHTLIAGNWNWTSNAVDARWLGPQSNSLIYSSKPNYLAVWPPYGPDTAGKGTNLLPAEARFRGIATP